MSWLFATGMVYVKVVGLTGGIGTGKTEVAGILRGLGAEVLSADHLAHETYLRGTKGWQEIVDEFGQRVLAPDGEIDRKNLGAMVFQHPARLERLNAIVHPRTRELIAERLRRLADEGAPVAVVEVALLAEAIREDAAWTALIDEVWVVVAPEDTVVGRVVSRGGLDAEAIRARVRAQATQDERRKIADVIVENDGSLERLREHVEGLWQERLAQA
jgi:dephospho-CoA kinase